MAALAVLLLACLVLFITGTFEENTDGGDLRFS